MSEWARNAKASYGPIEPDPSVAGRAGFKVPFEGSIKGHRTAGYLLATSSKTRFVEFIVTAPPSGSGDVTRALESVQKAEIRD